MLRARSVLVSSRRRAASTGLAWLLLSTQEFGPTAGVYVAIIRSIWLLRARIYVVLMPRSHIQRSPAEFVDRQKVAEIQIRQGVERIFRLKSTLSHDGRGSGGALWTSRPAPVRTLGRGSGGALWTSLSMPGPRQNTNGSRAKPARHMGGRRPTFGQWSIGLSMPAQHPADTRAGSAQRRACVSDVCGCYGVYMTTFQEARNSHIDSRIATKIK